MENFKNSIEGKIGVQKYLCTIYWRNGELLMDEPLTLGGKDLGPDPFSTLLASLAGCTLSTLRMYIDRKEWNIDEIKISMSLTQDNSDMMVTTITRSLNFSTEITEEQQKRLLLIAEKCPVSKLLKGTINIDTTISNK